MLIKHHKSSIRCLKDSCGNPITDPIHLNNHIREFYVGLYSTEKWVSVRSEVNNITNQVNISTSPSNDEIKSALFAMKPLKAPGLDGFHPIFFQKEWAIVGSDICTYIRSWFQKADIPSDLGHALICLIPK